MNNNFTNIVCRLAFIVYRGGPTGRVLPHDCTPNSIFSVNKNMTATFKTIRKVEKGQPLSMNYITIDPLCKPVNERVVLFAQLLIEPCRCVRCSSATEGHLILHTFAYLI